MTARTILTPLLVAAVTHSSVAEQPPMYQADQARLSAAILRPTAHHRGIVDGSILNLCLLAIGPHANDVALSLEPKELALIRVRQGSSRPFNLVGGDSPIRWPPFLRSRSELDALCREIETLRASRLDPDRLCYLLRELRRLAKQVQNISPQERLRKVQSLRMLSQLQHDLCGPANCVSCAEPANRYEGDGHCLVRFLLQTGLSFAPAPDNVAAGVYYKVFNQLCSVLHQVWDPELIALAATRAEQRAEQRQEELEERWAKVSKRAQGRQSARTQRLASKSSPDYVVPSYMSGYTVPLSPPRVNPRSYRSYTYPVYRYRTYRTYRWVTH